MSGTTGVSAPWEPERYELASAPVYHLISIGAISSSFSVPAFWCFPS
jgi:hypothetical protein